MHELQSLPIGASVTVFVAAGAVIGFAGVRMARVSDALADVTGWGEAMFGGVLLGASTSLPGIVASITAAAEGAPRLAFSNAIGGIAAQTVFLVIADLAYRPTNLEHAAASLSNIMQGALLTLLLMLVLLLVTAPAWTVAGVHPGSAGLILTYVLGVRLIRGARGANTWRAAMTPETVADRPALGPYARPSALWRRFAAYGVLLVFSGYTIAESALAITRATELDETLVGAVFTAVTTSIPELVISVAAVRQGALTLAVGNIIGGNSFDVLFVAVADVAFREGSIYHECDAHQIFVIALAAAQTAVLILGLLRRQRRGIANIGFEGVLILLLYASGIAVLTSAGAGR